MLVPWLKFTWQKGINNDSEFTLSVMTGYLGIDFANKRQQGGGKHQKVAQEIYRTRVKLGLSAVSLRLRLS